MTKPPKAIPTSARQASKRRFGSRVAEPLGVSTLVALRSDAQATPAFVRPFPSSAPTWRETEDGSDHVLRAIPLGATLAPFPGHHRHSLHPLFLRSNTVCVWGISRDHPSTHRRIPPDDWRDFHDAQFDGDTILDADGKVLWTDVWIVPLLYSPDVASSLADRLLRTVVYDTILKSRDICLIVLWSNAIDLGRLVSSHFVLDEKGLWHVDLPQYGGAEAFWCRYRRHRLDLTIDVPEPVRVLFNVLYDRHRRLFELLSLGTLAADGFCTASNQRVAIEPYLWDRHDIAVELNHGDVIDRASNRILYRDVVLRLPKQDPAANRDVTISHPRTNPGGRPEKYAYLEAFDDVAARMLRDRSPKTGAELVDWMLDAFQTRNHKTPDEKSVRDWLGKWLPELWARATAR